MGDSFCWDESTFDDEGSHSDVADSLNSSLVQWSLPVARAATTVAERCMSISPQHVTGAIEQMQAVLLGSQTTRGDELQRASDCLRSPSASTSDIMESLSSALDQQQHINRTHSHMVQLNSFVNVANYARHQKIEQALVQGHRHLNRLSDQMVVQEETIDNLEHSVDGLRQEVSVQRQVSGRLSMSLDEQGEMIRDSIKEQRRELDQQSAILAKQQQLIERMVKNKLRQDCLIDCGLAASSLLAVNTLFFSLPLGLLLAMVPHMKLRKWLKQCIKLAAASRLFLLMRPYAIKAGAHSGTGAFIPYAREGAVTTVHMVRFLLRHLRFGMQRSAHMLQGR